MLSVGTTAHTRSHATDAANIKKTAHTPITAMHPAPPMMIPTRAKIERCGTVMTATGATDTTRTPPGNIVNRTLRWYTNATESNWAHD
mmetsp:Transcript_66618/g.77308  ORF Transcript_66618/g.77308 Transcript_66618/m.77308 type:complete len:88 (-) Transcript_66618:45-308(-)